MDNQYIYLVYTEGGYQNPWDVKDFRGAYDSREKAEARMSHFDPKEAWIETVILNEDVVHYHPKWTNFNPNKV